MRTIIEIPDEQVQALDELVAKRDTSRAALIREGIDLVLERERGEVNALERAFGLWQNATAKNNALAAKSNDNIKSAIVSIEIKEKDASLPNESVAEAIPIAQQAATEPAAEASVPLAAPAAPAAKESSENLQESTPVPVPAAPVSVARPLGDEVWPASFFNVVPPKTGEGNAA